MDANSVPPETHAKKSHTYEVLSKKIDKLQGSLIDYLSPKFEELRIQQTAKIEELVNELKNIEYCSKVCSGAETSTESDITPSGTPSLVAEPSGTADVKSKPDRLRLFISSEQKRLAKCGDIPASPCKFVLPNDAVFNLDETTEDIYTTLYGIQSSLLTSGQPYKTWLWQLTPYVSAAIRNIIMSLAQENRDTWFDFVTEIVPGGAIETLEARYLQMWNKLGINKKETIRQFLYRAYSIWCGLPAAHRNEKAGINAIDKALREYETYVNHYAPETGYSSVRHLIWVVNQNIGDDVVNSR